MLEAARSAFEEGGLAVPLGEIARRAGVGPGTVYRHFPSKEALFRATVVDRIRLFTDTARELADAADPGAVFFRYLAAVVRLSARNKALQDALEASAEGRFRPSEDVEQGFHAALRVLLTRAQESGDVRKDVDTEDVVALLFGCLSMERHRGTGAPAGRMTALMCDSLRVGRGGNVTKLPVVRGSRNETGRCAVCGEAVRVARTGRPARYCGGGCRQRAHRERVRGRG
ncbi:TetR/AcrR family transcriptional regulator [Streptomyces albireticuli]|uniref:TetR/AcrR family transcriptional regulator n=1 Tax=Streptomyces albireticuli TaxID=1940 RepID=UPI001F44FC0F|nr:TetR/AcrR family transcriptional regulator [Streptomyces albireticuli]